VGLGEVITIAHTKGGSGKSSLASNLGYCLSERGYQVLIIDLDGQGSISSHLGGVVAKRADTGAVLDSGAVLSARCTLLEACVTDIFPGLSIVPSDEVSLDQAVGELESQGALGQLRLYELLDRERLNWDFIIIDTPGHQGMALAAALVASTGIIIPVIPEAGPVAELRTVLSSIAALSEQTLPLEVYGLVRMRVGGNSNYRRVAEQQSRDIAASANVPMFRNKIPEDARFGEAQLMGVPVRAHDKRARSAIAFRYLTEELLERKGWRAPLALNHDSTQVATATLTAPVSATVSVSAPTDSEVDVFLDVAEAADVVSAIGSESQ
jgi:chromosome partitioning protein